jgi:hypothetical protein
LRLRLQIPPPLLLEFQASKSALKLPLPKDCAAAAADDLEEERRAVLQRLGEELQQVALVVGVDEDAEVRTRSWSSFTACGRGLVSMLFTRSQTLA